MEQSPQDGAQLAAQPDVETLRTALARQEALRGLVAQRKRPERLFLSNQELAGMSDEAIEEAVQEALNRPVDGHNNGVMSARSKFLRRVEQVMADRLAKTRGALEEAGVDAAPPLGEQGPAAGNTHPEFAA